MCIVCNDLFPLVEIITVGFLLDIEREIQRKSPEDDPEDHYRGHIISNENRR